MTSKEQITYIKVCDLKGNKRNPRKNDEAVNVVAESIKRYGFRNPLIVDKDNVVWCGNTRYKASKVLGLEEVPCIVVDNLTQKQMQELALLDNKTNEIAEWDKEMLAEILTDCDLDDFGLDWDSMLADEQEVEINEDEVPEVSDFGEPICKVGDIWELGDHRLMCGDSTIANDVSALMDGNLADLVVTDPPYNVSYTGKTADELTIQNDDMSDDNFTEFLTKAFKCMSDNLKAGGVYYCWYAFWKHTSFEKALLDNGFKISEMLIWNKNCFTLGRSDYQWKHEPCFYGWKDGASHYFIDDRTQTTVIEDKGTDLKKLKKEEMLKLLQDIFSDKVSTTVINEDKPARSEEHPTMKPVKLFARLIKNSSRQGEIVLDLFGGSGTTIIACEQLGRKSYTMEFDPHYCDVIIERWQNFTGKKAKKVKGS